jgi:hypothetical protein
VSTPTRNKCGAFLAEAIARAGYASHSRKSMMTNIVNLIQQDPNVASVGFGDYPVPYRKSIDLKSDRLLRRVKRYANR